MKKQRRRDMDGVAGEVINDGDQQQLRGTGAVVVENMRRAADRDINLLKMSKIPVSKNKSQMFTRFNPSRFFFTAT